MSHTCGNTGRRQELPCINCDCESSARPDGSNSEDRLRALMEGLEIRDIDNAIKASPDHCRRLGVEIATAAKLGAHLYQAKKMAGI